MTFSFQPAINLRNGIHNSRNICYRIHRMIRTGRMAAFSGNRHLHSHNALMTHRRPQFSWLAYYRIICMSKSFQRFFQSDAARFLIRYIAQDQFPTINLTRIQQFAYSGNLRGNSPLHIGYTEAEEPAV